MPPEGGVSCEGGRSSFRQERSLLLQDVDGSHGRHDPATDADSTSAACDHLLGEALDRERPAVAVGCASGHRHDAGEEVLEGDRRDDDRERECHDRSEGFEHHRVAVKAVPLDHLHEDDAEGAEERGDDARPCKGLHAADQKLDHGFSLKMSLFRDGKGIPII